MLDRYYVLLMIGVLAYVLYRERIRFSVASLTLFCMFALYGAGYLFFVWSSDIDDHILDRATLCMIAMWACVIAGMESVRLALPRAARRAAHLYGTWDAQPIQDDGASVRLLVFFSFLIAIFLVAQFLAGGVWFSVIEFLAQTDSEARKEARFLYGGAGGYLYLVMSGPIAAWISFYLLAKWYVTRQKLVLLGWVVLASATMLAKFGTLAKAPWVLFFMQTVLVLYVVRKLTIRVWAIVAFGVLGLASLLLTSLIAFPDADVFSIPPYLVHRVFYIPNEGFYQTLYVYPEYLPHTWGLNIGLLHSLFGSGELIPAYARVADFFGAFGANFNALFIADAWVDFGWAGVISISLLVGVVIKLLDLYYAQFGKTPLCVACLLAALYGIDQLLATSAFTAFLSGGLLSIPLLLFLIRGARPAMAAVWSGTTPRRDQLIASTSSR